MVFRPKLIRSAGVSLLALPAFIAAFILYRTTVNIPYEDDYDAILDFLLRYTKEAGWMARAGWILTAQHVQYRLWFLNSVVALQNAICGHVQFVWLQQLGNAFLFLTAYLFWRMAAAYGGSRERHILLFCPVSALLFTLQYGRTMNWAMAGLQNLSVISFAILTFFALANPRSRKGFLLGMLTMVLSIACSGNGFFVAAVSALQLLLQQRWRALSMQIALTLLVAAIYFFHYDMVTPGVAESLPATALVVLVTPFVLLGAVFNSLRLAFCAGLVIVTLFAVLVRSGWYRSQPSACFFTLFCLITALGIAFTRRRLGIEVGLSDRYHMYSLFAIAALYLGVLKTWLAPTKPIPSTWRLSLVVVGALCWIHMLRVDVPMYRELLTRKKLLESHVILWERSPAASLVMPDETHTSKGPDWIALQIRSTETMRASIAAGIYDPPLHASDSMPIHVPQ